MPRKTFVAATFSQRLKLCFLQLFIHSRDYYIEKLSQKLHDTLPGVTILLKSLVRAERMRSRYQKVVVERVVSPRRRAC